MSLNVLRRKLALGTAQLGLSYGISNKTGKPEQKEAFGILDLAHASQIRLLDSAEAYGDSLKVIASYLAAHKGRGFDIISKFTDDGYPVHEKVHRVLRQLGSRQLYGYLYHRFSDYKSGRCRRELDALIAEGSIGRVGVSVYGDEEFETVLDDPLISIIQIPLHPLDNTPVKKKLMERARNAGKEIHVRSIFLQGLLFKPAGSLTGNLKAFAPSIEGFHSMLASLNLSVREACLNYALHQKFVDYVIIGVDTREQLSENLEVVTEDFPDSIMLALESIESPPAALLNPSNWKP